MVSLKPLKSSNVLSEEEALAELERIVTSTGDATRRPARTDQNPAREGYVHVPGNAFSPELMQHYRDPALNLDLQNGLYVGKKRLQKTDEVIQIGRRLGIDLSTRSESYGFLGAINWHEAKQLVEQGLQGRILTPALYFPILKWAEANNTDFAKDLVEYAERLDAVTKEGAKNKKARFLVHTDKDLNGGKDYGKVVLAEDKPFDYGNVEQLSGLPKTLKGSGKFKQWYPEQSPTAAIRDWDGSGPLLSLGGGPGYVSGGLGVRVAKIFPIRNQSKIKQRNF